ncbi:Srn2 [Kluyveromyces lactis]|nr:Srn2 [Kluyveromyces lactis]
MSLPELPPRPDRPKSTESLHCSDVDLPENVDLLTVNDIQQLLQQQDMPKEYAKRFNDNLVQDISNKSVAWKTQAEQLIEGLNKLAENKRHLKGELDSFKKLEFEYMKKWQDLDLLINSKFSNNALKKQLRHNVINLDEKSSHMVNEVPVTDESLDLFLEQYVNERTEYHLQREKLATWEQQDTLRLP